MQLARIDEDMPMSHSHRTELLTSAISASLVCLMLGLLVFIPTVGSQDELGGQQALHVVSDTGASGHRQ